MATKKTTRKTTARKTSESGSTATKKKATSKKAPARKSSAKKSSAKKSPAKAGSKTTAQKGGGGYPNMVRVEREIGGRTLSLETGRMAKLADGAVVARYGDTMILATAQADSRDRDDIDFFPLTVDYREKAAAGGKFPGGFFKREGRPTTREILTCRIVDRSIRPLFADGFRRETQVLLQVLSTDREQESDILAAIGGFAALAISSIPNGKTLGACRIGLIGGKLKINPTWTELQSDDNQLNLTVSAHEDAVVMVEAGANQLGEDVILEALELAHEVCTEVADMIEELVEKAGKPKIQVKAAEKDDKLHKAIERKFGKELKAAAVGGGSKHDRGETKNAIKAEVKAAFPAPAKADEKEAAAHAKEVSAAIGDLFKQGERESILNGVRADGRGHTEIRPLTMEVGVLPRVHGSALFTRGETQTLCTATLGTTEDQQFMDGIYPEERKRWLLHYAFPPFSVGEVRRFLAPGRREIGHGALAERSVEVVLPPKDKFNYSLRVTSEVLESNGSSSMATVCGATLALMDAGVPIKQPVAGIAMGLVMEGKKIAIVSDILGSEDHCGDMDFKVSGTGKGITAIQMDIKCEGLTRETLEDALDQAREGRLHILREMLKTIREPRTDVSRHAPRLISFQIPSDKIGAIIGPGGRTIRGMQEEFEARIAVLDEGMVEVCGSDADKVDACIARIQEMTAEVEIGQVYKGRVTGVKEFGAFVEILPGQEGLVHVSELDSGFIRSVTDVVAIGDEVEVKVIDIDDFGKVKLSRKALMAPSEGGGDEERGERRPPRGRDSEDRPRSRRGRDDEDRPTPSPRRGRDDEDRPTPSPRRGRDDDDRPTPSPRRGRDDDDRPTPSPRRGRDDDDRPRRGPRDAEDRPTPSPRRGRDDDDRPRRGRDDEDRPRRGRDDEDRPRRGRRDDEDRPAPSLRRGRDDEDRPSARRGRDDEDRPRRGRHDEDRPSPRRGRDDEDRPTPSPRRGRDDEDRPRRGRRDEGDRPSPRRGRDDEDRPTPSPRRGRDDDDRPTPSRGRDDEDRPRRGRHDEDRPRSRRSRDDERPDDDAGPVAEAGGRERSQRRRRRR